MTRLIAKVSPATDFASLQEQVAKQGSPWIQDFRSEAGVCFAREGLPHSRMENWRDTRLTAIVKGEFTLPGEQPLQQAREILSSLPAGSDPADLHIVFVNGAFCESLSSLPAAASVSAIALSRADESMTGNAKAGLGVLADPTGHPFTALNGSLLNDVVLLVVEKDTRPAGSIRITHIACGDPQNGKARLTCPRSVILAGKRSAFTVIETFAGDRSAQAALTTAVTEVSVASQASVDYHRIQMEDLNSFHIGRFQGRVEEGAELKATSISLGAALDRVDAGVVLAGENAECDLDGLFFTDGERHADNRTVIEHAVPNCKSRQVYKGILSGHSSAVFMGRVIVRPDAQKTDADQSNPNLLLSDDATIHTRPQLEIYADDVRCTHGATVGRLDEDALFYIRSRGIGLEEATNLMVKGFGGEILNRIDDVNVRLHLERELDSRLAAASGSKG